MEFTPIIETIEPFCYGLIPFAVLAGFLYFIYYVIRKIRKK